MNQLEEAVERRKRFEEWWKIHAKHFPEYKHACPENTCRKEIAFDCFLAGCVFAQGKIFQEFQELKQ